MEKFIRDSIKTDYWLRFNSLDTSSKFYTEDEYSKKGQVAAKKDETGETSIEYEYIEGTTVVRSEKHANGSTFAYGHDIDDTVTAITQSTAAGEENSTQIAYTLGEVTELKSGNNVVRYEYDGKHRNTAIDLNGKENYETYSHEEGETEDAVTVTNAKGETFTSVSDKKGNIIRELYNGEEQVSYTYDENGKVIAEKEGDEVSRSEYDSLGRIARFIREKCPEGNDTLEDSEENIPNVKYSEAFKYDNFGQLKTCNKNGREYVYNYKENAARDLDNITVNEVIKTNEAEKVDVNITVTPETDILGRKKSKEISLNGSRLAGEYLYYRKVGDHATNMPSAVYFGEIKKAQYAISDSLKYEYDKNGNICKIFENGALAVRYEYDSIDRLVREDNKKLGFTTLFAYDNCGNIISKRTTKFTLKSNVEECVFEELLYSYDGDRLLSFGNEEFNYDDIGNPTRYRDITAEWGKGRQLFKLADMQFSYDANGARRRKYGSYERTNAVGEKEKVNVDIEYIYDSDGKLIASSDKLEYLYDDAGLFGIKYDGKIYFYRKDAQGNIVALLDSNGAIVVKYVYDAWGNHAVLDGKGNDVPDDVADERIIGILNPFRYREYFYDVETGLYYLQSRYYDPELGRFITIDGVEYLSYKSINGLNLYAYCGNNPVMRSDFDGTSWISDKWNQVKNWAKEKWNKVKSAAKTVWNHVKKVATAVGNFVKKNWDIILGVALVIGSIALSIVTFGAGATIAGIVCGAVIGGAIGALSAYSRGENVLAGFVSGLVVGATGAVNPFAGGLAAAGMTFITERVNGNQPSKDTVAKAIFNGMVGTLFAWVGDGFGKLMTSGSKELLTGIVANSISSFIFSSYSFIWDTINSMFLWRA